MDVKALILLDEAAATTAHLGSDGAADEFPLLLIDVLGRPVLHRLADRLLQFAISEVGVVTNLNSQSAGLQRRTMRPDLKWTSVSGAAIWRAAENKFSEFAQAGAELVIVIRTGAFAELDFDELIQFHLDQRGRVTCVRDQDEKPLDVFVISASRRNDAAFLFRHQLREFRVPCVNYAFSGYCNHLRSNADLRRLTVDGLLQRAQIVPTGTQVRPGVWVGEGAHIHRRARVLAPAFVGAHAKIRAAAVITRCSALEHHAEVDCGTVVEDSNILPYTYVGAGLDVAHSIVGFRRLTNLRRNVEVEITDAKLVNTVSPHAPLRALADAASLATFLPTQVLRGLFARPRREPATLLPKAVQAPSPALSNPKLQPEASSAQKTQFPADLAVARRYGNE